MPISAGLCPSDREAGAATARGGGVGIDDAEGGADQVVDKIDLRTRHVAERDLVDEDPRSCPLDDEIIGLRSLDQIELILEARAAAALDAHPQKRLVGLAGDDL